MELWGTDVGLWGTEVGLWGTNMELWGTDVGSLLSVSRSRPTAVGQPGLPLLRCGVAVGR